MAKNEFEDLDEFDDIKDIVESDEVSEQANQDGAEDLGGELKEEMQRPNVASQRTPQRQPQRPVQQAQPPQQMQRRVIPLTAQQQQQQQQKILQMQARQQQQQVETEAEQPVQGDRFTYYKIPPRQGLFDNVLGKPYLETEDTLNLILALMIEQRNALDRLENQVS